MSREILFLSPVFKECIWGGTRLKAFGYTLPSETVGECWGVSAHPHGDVTVFGGTYAGMHLSELWTQRRDMFGGIPGTRFPILTKIIDARTDLSIQVHPDDAYAAAHEHGSAGKTECWYILDASPGATIVVGHNAPTKDAAAHMIREQRWAEFIREVPVHKGDFFFIEPGTVHAIKGGTLVLETQQPSDVTYRLYDYDRLQNGVPRELHIAESLAVLTAPFVAVSPPHNPAKTVNTAMEQLVSCPFFTVWRVRCSGEMQLVQDQPFLVLSVVAGAGTIAGQPIRAGTHCIVPADYGIIPIVGTLEMIVSSP
ncbi:MAG: class I mannose-6-phosphate isomerase [Treponema sp.]|nr:class I mannose-6-phosphate isomerase [Treponema sp.]